VAFFLSDGEHDAAAEDGSGVEPEPGVWCRRGADDEPDGDDPAGHGERDRNHRAAGCDLGLRAAVDGHQRGCLAVREDRDLPAERHPGAGPRWPPAALQGGLRDRPHEGGAVTAGVGDRVKRGQQRVRPRVEAVAQPDEAAAPRDQAPAGQRDALDDAHEVHV
jgi:hypothetical protein